MGLWQPSIAACLQTCQPVTMLMMNFSCAQAYDEQRRRRDAEREAKELAEEEEAERLAAKKQAREDAEAAKWMGQIAVEQQGEEAQSEEQAQVGPCTESATLLRCSFPHPRRSRIGDQCLCCAM